MEIKNRLFPYPVLCEETDDYLEGSFDVEMTFEEKLSNFKLTFEMKLENDGINNLIRRGDAEYVIHIEGTSTSFRKAIKTDLNQLIYEIPKSRVNNEISVVVMIVAKKKIEDYTNSMLNIDYEDEKIIFDKASILAYKNMSKIFISKEYEELAGNESLFCVVKKMDIDKEEEKPIIFSLEEDRIKILVDERTYDSYISFQHIPSLAMALLVFPALVYMIEELRVNSSAYRKRLWFVKMNQYYKAMGKDFESDIIQSNNNAVEIAQEMIKFPLSKAYIELKQGEI